MARSALGGASAHAPSSLKYSCVVNCCKHFCELAKKKKKKSLLKLAAYEGKIFSIPALAEQHVSVDGLHSLLYMRVLLLGKHAGFGRQHPTDRTMSFASLFQMNL